MTTPTMQQIDMKWHRRLLIFASTIAAIIPLAQIQAAVDDTSNDKTKRRYRSRIPASEQRSGDPEKGYKYLVEGDYIVSGVPIGLFTMARPAGKNQLNRSGDQAALPYHYTAVTSPNGVRVVTSNCLRCHAQTLNGKFIFGLGNSTVDFTADRSATVNMVDTMITGLHGADSLERAAYKTLHERFLLISPLIQTKVRGVNPADSLALVLGRHRNPETLEWISQPATSKDTPKDQVIPTDVPALWLLKKKNALYYTASGRGDFARLIMASSLLTLKDSKEATQIDKHFADVLAYLETLEAPKWPKEINADLVSQGAQIFRDECVRCHGEHGPKANYPNYMIKLDTIKTDPLLSQWQNSVDSHSYKNSWFGKGPHAARLEPGNGYIAPPLDGIWATAPYLHNGSVPDLRTLLNSKLRPRFWQRTFNTSDYDFDNIGWEYQARADNNNGDTNIYDTTLTGYGNQGHSFADDLSEKQRQALLEYLKTL